MARLTRSTKPPKDLQQWMKDGDYLPAPLKDFHDQKEIFKRIWEIVKKCKAKDKHHTFNLDQEFNWVTSHVFTIDFFLWFMAQHGYTLQKTRNRVANLSDLSATMKDFEDRQIEQFREMFQEVRRLSDESQPDRGQPNTATDIR